MTTPLKPPPVVRAVAPKYSVIGTKAAKGHPSRKVLYWGLPFTGKTLYAKSWPSPLFLYFDPDSTTLRCGSTEFPVVYVTSKAIMDALAKDVKNRKLTEVVRSLGDEWSNYTVKTVVIDSSTFQDRIVEEWLDITEAKGINRWDVKTKAFYSFYDDVCAGAEYREDAEQYNIVATAHEHTKRDKEGNVIKVTHCISGGFDDKFTQYFDTVIFTSRELPSTAEGKVIGEAKYLCKTTPPDKWRAGGSRGDVKYPPVLPNGAFYSELQKCWGETEPKEK